MIKITTLNNFENESKPKKHTYMCQLNEQININYKNKNNNK